jgi:branched-chain amino acid transport system ATP-binding protein
LAQPLEMTLAPPAAASVDLDLSGLQAWYGESHVLHGIDLQVRRGELVTLMGRNGAGKTTTLNCINGLMRKRSGRVTFRGTEISRATPERIARLGVATCPEDRAIFSSLTVKENLHLPPLLNDRGMRDDEIFDLFPNLRERLSTASGTRLSGGEQQMLAIARILRSGADFLILDEPTEGLAPIIIDQIAATLKILRARGYTVLLVEQNFRFAQAVADRHYMMDEGRIVDAFDNDLSAGMQARIEKYLSL